MFEITDKFHDIIPNGWKCYVVSGMRPFGTRLAMYPSPKTVFYVATDHNYYDKEFIEELPVCVRAVQKAIQNKKIKNLEKALIKALYGLKELSYMNCFAPGEILKDARYAECLRREILQDLHNEEISIPEIKDWKSLYRLRRRDSKKIVKFKERRNENNSKA